MMTFFTFRLPDSPPAFDRWPWRGIFQQTGYSRIRRCFTSPLMPMRYTRFFSLKSLVAMGLAVAIIPLCLALLSAASAVRETSALGRSMNYQVFEQTKAVRLVLRKTSDIERKARLFVLLSDPSLRQPYERNAYEAARASFKQALGELLKLPVDGKIALLAGELSEKENLIYRQTVGPETESHPRLPVEEAFIGLREASNALSREFEDGVDRRFEQLRGQSASLERELLLKGAALLGTSVLCIGMLLALLMRSIRRLGASIHRLESGNLADAIKLDGPADIRHLGNRLEWLRLRLLELEASKRPRMENAANAGATGTPLERIAEIEAAALLADLEQNPQRRDTPHVRADSRPKKRSKVSGTPDATIQGQPFPLPDEA